MSFSGCDRQERSAIIKTSGQCKVAPANKLEARDLELIANYIQQPLLAQQKS